MSGVVRSLHSRAGIGTTATVVQHASFRLSSVTVDGPALLLMRHGRKTLRAGGRRWQAGPGDVVVMAGGQTLDIENRLSADGLFAACWLGWDADLLARAAPLAAGRPPLSNVAVLKGVPASFQAAIARAVDAIGAEPALPEAIAAHRLAELFLWLAEQGVTVSAGRTTSTAARLRGMVAGAPAMPWTAATAAGRIATSEATLRRRLGAEGTTFNAVLTHARMSLALTLLQSTERPVAAIAADVGYESASRFAVRFKHRYGFSPSVVRGHRR